MKRISIYFLFILFLAFSQACNNGSSVDPYTENSENTDLAYDSLHSDNLYDDGDETHYDGEPMDDISDEDTEDDFLKCINCGDHFYKEEGWFQGGRYGVYKYGDPDYESKNIVFGIIGGSELEPDFCCKRCAREY
jgi:hypothetical protein